MPKKNLRHSEGSTRMRIAERTTWGLFLALAVALVLRVPYLTTRSIWYDEASSWQTASFPLSGTLDSLRLNVHPPLYYWVLKAWMAAFGESVLALRGLSVLFGLLTVAGMYLAASRCTVRARAGASARDGSFLPTAVALLVAVNAFQVNAAIEARMYALGAALTAFSVWALLGLLADPSSRSRWIACIGLCTAMVYIHHHCLFVVASEFAFLFGYSAWELRRRARDAQVLLFRSLAAAAVIAAAYLPGLVLMLRQLGRVREDYWTEPLSVDLVERTFLEFISPVTRASDPAFWGGFCLAAFLVAVAIVGLTANRDESLVLAVAVLPMVFTAVVTLFVSRVWDGHFFRFSQLFLLFVLALAVSKVIPRRPVQGATLAVLVLGMVVASVNFWINREIPTRPGMRGAMERILSLRKGNELIVANSNIHYFPAKYYAPKVVPVRIRESAAHGFWCRHLIRPADVLSEVDFRASLAEGVWLLSHWETPADEDDLADAVVDVRFEVPYDFGVFPRTIYVSHLRVPDEGAKERVVRMRPIPINVEGP